ncbi:hypothetical protein [Vibrio cyclitrophicus]|uniref:hypothetical protein n=1 Tax=Vibrio cyclitrophicus TaxID=47951 RepID=UPI00399B3BCE
MNNKQPWLNAMENGVLGEARAKALLLERFWVLEESVDVQGADYLIQRKLNETNFMDKEAPKLGVVQVKFIQNGDTYISIKKSYVCDQYGEPYNEFFLLVFSGSEDDAQSYLLSAKDIINEFYTKGEDENCIFKVAGKNIIESTNYKITNKCSALNTIEHALKESSFRDNRRFLGSTSYIKLAPEQINQDLLLPLDNGYADFQKEFYENKKNLQHTLFCIEDAVEVINKILACTDPEEAFDIYEDQLTEYVWNDNLSFSIDCFNDEDFLTAIKNHKERLMALRDKGLENNFLHLMYRYKKSMITKLSKMEFTKDSKIKVVASYCSESLEDISVNITVIEDEGHAYPFVKKSELGYQEIIYKPYSWFQVCSYNTKVANIEKTYTKAEMLEKKHWQYCRAFQVAVEKLLIGEELVSPWMIRT